MHAFRSTLFLLFALLSACAVASVTGKFNIASKYNIQKHLPNGTIITEVKRNPVLYQKEVKSQKTLDKMVREFSRWSHNEFNCKKADRASSY
jgi:hypothetical protein